MKKSLILMMISLLSLTSITTVTQAATLDKEQQTQVRALIRETLINDPSILEEAIAALQQQKQTEAVQQAANAIKINYDKLYNDPLSPRIGAKNAKLVLVTFTDYNCPFCKRFDPQLVDLVKKYPDIAIVFKLLPYKGATSMEASELMTALWMKDPDAFLAAHEMLMKKQSALTSADIKKVLASTPYAHLKVTDEAKKAIQANLSLAQQLGVTGTPSTLIGNQFIPGAIDAQQLNTIVAQQLEK